MIIGFDSKYKFKRTCERYNSKGVELIKKAKDEVKAKSTVNIAVLNCLNSFEDFWNSNIFYSKLDDWNDECCDVLRVLEKGLRYFCDKRRKKLELSYCEEEIQKMMEELKKYIVEEKDAEDIEEIIEKKDKEISYSYNESMPSQVLFDYIDCNIRKMELLDKYEGENNKAEILKFQFVKDRIQQLGISDSYMAQILYREIKGELSWGSRWDDEMEEIILYLEIYSCVIKESTVSEKELRFRYSPCI